VSLSLPSLSLAGMSGFERKTDMTMPTSAESAVWRGMSRAELDAAYNNSAHVADSAAKLADWSKRSAQLRAKHPRLLDLAYGERPRNRVDVFPCSVPNAPLFVFIHGGYWQRNAKEIFSCMAQGPMARGFDVALPGYTLAPDASLTAIVAEIRAAIRWLRREGPRHGIGRGRMIVGGWSAGGHLTAMTMGMPEVAASLPISGVFDIEPCRLNYLNDKLNLTTDEAAALSPLHHLPTKAGPLCVAYGTAELPELQRQSQAYFQAWTKAGLSGVILRLEGHNHFSILEELAAPDGGLSAALCELRAQINS
jgi:arylformamidase